jgi:hypothetical protein
MPFPKGRVQRQLIGGRNLESASLGRQKNHQPGGEANTKEKTGKQRMQSQPRVDIEAKAS